ncbi:hypothetical protein BKA81DRAFT_383091 [Phyllosticta paracitricarpa]
MALLWTIFLGALRSSLVKQFADLWHVVVVSSKNTWEVPIHSVSTAPETPATTDFAELNILIRRTSPLSFVERPRIRDVPWIHTGPSRLWLAPILPACQALIETCVLVVAVLQADFRAAVGGDFGALFARTNFDGRNIPPSGRFCGGSAQFCCGRAGYPSGWGEGEYLKAVTETAVRKRSTRRDIDIMLGTCGSICDKSDKVEQSGGQVSAA